MDRLGDLSQHINRQSQTLKQLLDNLLNWSLQQLGMYKAQNDRIELKELGKEIMGRYEALAESKGNKLLMEVEEGAIWHGDRNGLSVVLNTC